MKNTLKQITSFLLAVALYTMLAAFWLLFERGNSTLSDFVSYAVNLDDF